MGANEPNRNAPRRSLKFWGGVRDEIESNVSKEDYGPAGQDSRPAVRREGMIVRGMYELGCKSHKDQNGDDFQQHHDVVGPRGLLDAAHQDDRQEHHDDEGRPVKAEM